MLLLSPECSPSLKAVHLIVFSVFWLQIIPTVGVDGGDAEKNSDKMLKHFRNLVDENSAKAKFLSTFQRTPSLQAVQERDPGTQMGEESGGLEAGDELGTYEKPLQPVEFESDLSSGPLEDGGCALEGGWTPEGGRCPARRVGEEAGCGGTEGWDCDDALDSEIGGGSDGEKRDGVDSDRKGLRADSKEGPGEDPGCSQQEGSSLEVQQVLAVLGGELSASDAADLLLRCGGDVSRAINEFYDAAAAGRGQPGAAGSKPPAKPLAAGAAARGVKRKVGPGQSAGGGLGGGQPRGGKKQASAATGDGGQRAITAFFGGSGGAFGSGGGGGGAGVGVTPKKSPSVARKPAVPPGPSPGRNAIASMFAAHAAATSESPGSSFPLPSPASPLQETGTQSGSPAAAAAGMPGERDQDNKRARHSAVTSLGSAPSFADAGPAAGVAAAKAGSKPELSSDSGLNSPPVEGPLAQKEGTMALGSSPSPAPRIVLPPAPKPPKAAGAFFLSSSRSGGPMGAAAGSVGRPAPPTDAVLLSLGEYKPVEHAGWVAGEAAPYLHIAQAFQAMDSTTKRLRIGDALANMFRSVLALSPGEIGNDQRMDLAEPLHKCPTCCNCFGLGSGSLLNGFCCCRCFCV